MEKAIRERRNPEGRKRAGWGEIWKNGRISDDA
jgi:hypothetical protein